MPGRGGAPDRAPLDAMKGLVRRPVLAEDWAGDAAYRYGALLHVQGFFWEAHEVWEAVWLACAPNGRERRFLRALIQVANAALKVKMGRPRAAMRLLAEAGDLLGEVAAGLAAEPDGAACRSFMGVEVAGLQAALRDAAAALAGEEAITAVGQLTTPLGSAAGV